MKVRGFADRSEAGVLLAEALASYENQPGTMVLALPRGGVPVGYEIAKALRCPLDVLVVRKLGTPGQEELAMGAISSLGARELNQRELNQEVIDYLGIPPAEIEEVTRRETQELERREKAYRGSRPPLDVRGRVVLLVDDGLATGTTMRAAVSALRQQGPARVVAAIPVGAAESCSQLRNVVDELVCLIETEDLVAISMWYGDFRQTTDEQVRELLRKSEPASV